MTIATIQKIKREIKNELMQELIIPVLQNSRDAEGEYQEKFVNKILRLAKEKPKYKYDSKSFLKMFS